MSRQLRIEYENALYHIMARGNRKELIFYNDKDREFFLERISEMVIKHNIIIHCYVLMPNHYHILLETPEANLSRAMHFLNCSYVNWFRGKHKVVGPIFQGRFKAKLIEQEKYFCNASAYIHLNPLRSSLVSSAEEYPWSSYAYIIGERKSPCWLSNELILGEFSGNIIDYKHFVMESYLAKDDLTYEELFSKRGLILGSDVFKYKIKDMVINKVSEESKQELPEYNLLFRLSINDVKAILLDVLKTSEDVIFANKKNNLYRKIALYVFNRHTNATQKDIARLFSLNYATVSHTAKEVAKTANTNLELSALLRRIDEAIKKRRCQVLQNQ